MITRFSLAFKLRQSKSLPNGTTPIYLRITIGDDRVELSTKGNVLPDKWNAPMQKVSGTGEEARAINVYLKTKEQEVFQAHQELVLENKEVTAGNIKNKLLGQDTADLDGPGTKLVFASIAALVALLIATVLSIYKPLGMTAYAWRIQNNKPGVPAL